MTDAVRGNQNLLLRCAMLQTLDVITTLLFLSHGVAEANPLVKWSISLTRGNLAGLVAVKLLACVLAVMAVQSRRIQVVTKMNRFFTFLVLWNLIALSVSFRA
jgi:hypothetical protein